MEMGSIMNSLPLLRLDHLFSRLCWISAQIPTSPLWALLPLPPPPRHLSSEHIAHTPGILTRTCQLIASPCVAYKLLEGRSLVLLVAINPASARRLSTQQVPNKYLSNEKIGHFASSERDSFYLNPVFSQKNKFKKSSDPCFYCYYCLRRGDICFFKKKSKADVRKI